MHRFMKTRARLAGSPRKSSPLKHRHSLSTLRQTKRRRVVSGLGTGDVPSALSMSVSDDSDGSGSGAGSDRERELVRAEYIDRSDSEAETSWAGRRANGHALEDATNVVGRAKDGRPKGKGRSAELREKDGEDESSPRKRKRDDVESCSSDWVETDEDEPEFIAESDQHLLGGAPAYALHRLRKAELIRLWKVAGMWPESEDGDTVMGDGDNDDDDRGMGKNELVDGLIAARKPSSLSSPMKLGQTLTPRTSRSKSTSTLSSAPPTTSDDERPSRAIDLDATPRAAPRTRSKTRARITETTLVRSVRRPRGRRDKLRSRSLGNGDERRARFSDSAKSPAKALLTRNKRPASMSSSAYTTTDESAEEQPRPTPRRNKINGITPTRPRRGSAPKVLFETPPGQVSGAAVADDDDDAVDEPTPLVKRLRPRTQSRSGQGDFARATSSERDADDEGEQDDADDSPGPSSRTRSRGRERSASNASASSGKSGGSESGRSARSGRSSRPQRDAKRKAAKAIRGEAKDDAEDVDMAEVVSAEDVEATDISDEEEEDTSSRRQTRSQRATPPERRYRNPRASLDSSIVSSPPTSAALTALSDDDGDDEPTETKDLFGDATAQAAADGIVRTTRSGKPFGIWRSRRARLRQEAEEDEEMVVDEDEGNEEEEEEEGEDEFDAHADLRDATVASLTRLLRDELVQMCEARRIEVGGTKPQLARALLRWRDEQTAFDKKSTTSSQATARPDSSASSSAKTKKKRSPKGKGKDGKEGKLVHAVASHIHVDGKTTPVLLRDHIHVEDPATPGLEGGEEGKKEGESGLDLDLQELGLEERTIKPEHLVKLEKIGSGGFKDVYIGKYRGRKVAISEFRDHLSEMDIRELKLLSDFSHPNIVRFRGICIPEDNSQVPCMLISELCENGDLFDYIRNVPCPPTKRVFGLMLDIAKGLEYLHLHQPAVIHRDCKSSNILINRQGVAKVGDFGLARVKTSTRSMIRSLVGTVNWQAPELWHPHPRYDYKVDVFSAGMVYWEMLSGWIGEKTYPWEGHNEHYIYDAVGQKQRRPSVAGLRKHWGDEAVDLVQRMWHQDPALRPTMSDVVDDLQAMIADVKASEGRSR
ncbi:hypothetical protein Q5752_004083 [Cryptotrichosporon argae]